LKNNKQKREFRGVVIGNIVEVVWRDIYQRDSIRAKCFDDEKTMDRLTTVKPTITFGILVDIRNGCIVVSQELCTEENDRATMMEVIPVGVIDKIIKLVPATKRRKKKCQKKTILKNKKNHQ
jgi:hypothetical protein